MKVNTLGASPVVVLKLKPEKKASGVLRGAQGSAKEDCTTEWALGRKWNSIISPGWATTFSGSKWRPLFATVEPAVMRCITPVGVTVEGMAKALLRLASKEAARATVDGKASMMNYISDRKFLGLQIYGGALRVEFAIYEKMEV